MGDYEAPLNGFTRYSNTATTPDMSGLDQFFGFFLALGIVYWIIVIAVVTLQAIGKWKMFTKAGKDGWESLVPGHSEFVLFELAGIKTYWYFLLFIPFVNIAVTIWVMIELAKAYGKGAGFGVLMFFFPYICMPILGFGKAEFVGAGNSNGFNGNGRGNRNGGNGGFGGNGNNFGGNNITNPQNPYEYNQPNGRDDRGIFYNNTNNFQNRTAEPRNPLNQEGNANSADPYGENNSNVYFNKFYGRADDEPRNQSIYENKPVETSSNSYSNQPEASKKVETTNSIYSNRSSVEPTENKYTPTIDIEPKASNVYTPTFKPEEGNTNNAYKNFSDPLNTEEKPASVYTPTYHEEVKATEPENKQNTAFEPQPINKVQPVEPVRTATVQNVEETKPKAEEFQVKPQATTVKPVEPTEPAQSRISPVEVKKPEIPQVKVEEPVRPAPVQNVEAVKPKAEEFQVRPQVAPVNKPAEPVRPAPVQNVEEVKPKVEEEPVQRPATTPAQDLFNRINQTAPVSNVENVTANPSTNPNANLQQNNSYNVNANQNMNAVEPQQGYNNIKQANPYQQQTPPVQQPVQQSVQPQNQYNAANNSAPFNKTFSAATSENASGDFDKDNHVSKVSANFDNGFNPAPRRHFDPIDTNTLD